MSAQDREAAWADALAAWRLAYDAVNAHEYGRILTDHPEHDRLEKEHAVLGDIEVAALNALIATRAPSAATLIEKMQIVEAEYGGGAYFGELMTDIRCLYPSAAPNDRAAWAEAHADYLAKAAAEREIVPAEAGCDEANEAKCAARDHLIENVPAPHALAVAIKFDMVLECSIGFEGLFPDHVVAIRQDLWRLGEGEA